MKRTTTICLVLILSLLSSLFTTCLSAADLEPISTELPSSNELKLQLELTHVMMDMADSIDGRIPDQTNPFTDAKFNQNKLVSLIRDEANKFEQFYEKSGMIPEEKIPDFRKFFATIKWENLVQLMKKAHLGIDVFFKRRGYGVGIALMIAKSIKFSLIYFCIKHELTPLVPVIMNLPWTLASTLVPGKLQQLKINSELVQILGGKEQFAAYQEQEKKMLEVLQLSSEKDLLLPIESITETQVKSIVIKNNSPWKKFLNYIGMNSEELSYTNLKRFLKNNSIESGYYNWVINNKSLDDVAKTALISLSLLNSEEHTLKFQLQFSDQFKNFESNKNWDELLKWTRKMNEIHEVDKLIAAFQEIPNTLRPKEVALIWNDILFPKYIANLNLSYQEGRNLVFQSEALKARLSLLPASATQEEIQQELLDALGRVLSETSSKRCQVPASVIGEKLLQSF